MKDHERFFGLHFDFHANNEFEIGQRTNKEDIKWYIDATHPDFIQCDSKGHPGNSSYPTEIGKPDDKLTLDNLKIWCDAAKENNTPIYVHHSGIWDKAYTHAHPEHAQVEEDGSLTERASLFGPYAEEYLIPQVNEMIDKYDIEGIWMDGECWAVCSDYSSLAQKHIPKNASKDERDKIMREAFFDYMKKCGDAFHAHKKDFKYISNWAYSSYIPEKPIEGVLDSLSGDYPPTDSLYAARYEGRCLAAQNMPWDLMCWSFMHRWLFKPSGEAYVDERFQLWKSAAQLMQEAASTLVLGGGFQLYITQNKDGSIRKTHYTALKEAADFIHKRRINFKKKPLAQVGIFYSAESRYKDGKIFNAAGATNALIGAIHCILSTQYTLNVVLEYQLDTLSDYDIIVIPEWDKMSDTVKERLMEYAKNGGNLLIIGAKVCAQFGELAGLDFGKLQCEEGENVIRKMWMDDDGSFEIFSGDFLDLKFGEDCFYYNFDMRDTDIATYKISDYKKGKLAFVPFDLGTNYFATRSYKKANYLKKILNKLSKPVIEINRKNIDITMQKTDNGIYVNLLNMLQNRTDLSLDIYDEVPSIYDAQVTINMPYKNVKMPLGEEFEYEILENKVKVRLKKLDIHSIIELY